MGIDKSEYDVDFRERKEYLSAFFSSLREAGTYMSSDNLRVAIESLNMTLSGVKEKEEEENRRIRFEAEQEKARKREELLARVRAKVAKKKADEERAHILEITRMDLPDEWINSFDEDEVIHSESASEALDVCLSELGSVDIEYIAASAGMEINDCLTSLSDRIIQDPELWKECYYKGWVLLGDYLSGNISMKLMIAKKADEKYLGYFSRNVKLLEGFVSSIGKADIFVTLGTLWLPAKVIDDFIDHIIVDDEGNPAMLSGITTLHDEYTGKWEIRGKKSANAPELHGKYRTVLFEVYGTARMDALSLLENTLNMKTIQVYDKIENPVTDKTDRIANRSETLKLLERQERLVSEFRTWVWEDAERADELVRMYTEQYGIRLNKVFESAPLTLPGKNPAVTLYSHQNRAVRRILNTRNTLLAHEVGSGKTYSMIASGMELRRQGKSRKNMYVVPNSIISQWVSDFEFLYPGSDVMVVDNSNFSQRKMEKTLERMKDEDHDAIIIAYSCFDMIPLSRRWYREKCEDRISRLRKAAEKSGISMAQGIAAAEKTLKEVTEEEEKCARSICFDDLMVNTLFLDEAHNYKNVSFRTNITGVLGGAGKGSRKADGMMDKVRCIQRQNDGGRIVFATATPITNSITDIFVMQHYLQSGALEQLSLSSFNAWAAMYADKVTDFEIDVDTSSYHLVSRFSRFCNLPELTSLFAGVADFYRTDKDNGVSPAFDGYSDSFRDGSEEFHEYLSYISDRADDVRARRVSRVDDNLLKITSDGRKAGLDMRLIDEVFGLDPDSKVFRCAENVMKVYEDTAESLGTQLVFCDSSTPKESFNLYDELKRLLIAMGMSNDEVVFIHDYPDKRKRDVFINGMNDGTIRVAVGSTFKLGTGMNVQKRLAAIHHLDVPWRPSDMVQREGRILRQGNSCEKVRIFRYITRGSFDAYSWQLLEIKQRFISQILTGTVCEREAGDVDDTVLSYGEVKALAIGNPLLKTRVSVANEVDKVRMLLAERNEKVSIFRSELEKSGSRRCELQKKLEACINDIATAKRSFIPLSKLDKSEKEDTRNMIAEAVRKIGSEERYITSFCGFDIILPAGMKAGPEHVHKKPWVIMRGEGDYEVEIESEIGIMKRLSNMLSADAGNVSGLEKVRREISGEIEELDNSVTSMRKFLDEDPGYEKLLAELRKELAEIDDELGVREYA